MKETADKNYILKKSGGRFETKIKKINSRLDYAKMDEIKGKIAEGCITFINENGNFTGISKLPKEIIETPVKLANYKVYMNKYVNDYYKFLVSRFLEIKIPK